MEGKKALYFKQKHKYPNGDETAYSYIRITEDGSITMISTALERISKLKSVQLKKGFEVIDKGSFEIEADKIIKLINS